MGASDTLAQGVEHYQAGRLKEAVACFVSVLSEVPNHVDALHLLGLVMNRMGKVEQALDLFDRAIRQEPRHAPALANRSLPLRTLGRLDEAEATLRQALSARTSFAQARVMLGQVLMAKGDTHGALRAGQAALSEAPDRRDAHEIVGHSLLRLGRPGDAVPHLGRAASTGAPGAVLTLAQALLMVGRSDQAVQLLERYPNQDPAVRLAVAELLVRAGATDAAQSRLQVLIDEGVEPARDLLARLFRDGGNLHDALDLLRGDPLSAAQLNTRSTIHGLLGDVSAQLVDLRQAVSQNPDDGAAQHNLAVALFQAGRPDDALVAHRAAIQGTGGDRVRCIALAESLARANDLRGTEDLLWAALGTEGVDHQLLERALRRSLETLDVVRDALAGGELTTQLAAALDTPLAHGLLRRTRVLGPTWEALLTRLRRAMVLDGLLDSYPELATSIAVQAWYTQYAWWASHQELAAVASLRMANFEAWPCVAAYGPLPADTPQPASPGALPLWRMMVGDPARERALAGPLPVLGMTDDSVSAAVKEQYEDHPYPRLVSVHRKPPAALESLLRQIVPWFDEAPRPEGSLGVLIAGCGTGQQVLTAGCRYANAQILAVDLSRASLGMAARMVADWGLQHVRLAQADILALGALQERFHVIECGGVLHHMADPLAGWRVLSDLLVPDGVMKIGLYSEHARVDVVAARELAARRGWGTSDDQLRKARQELLGLPQGHPARGVLWSPDFASLSGFRDLVMHACEHRFTLQRLGESLDALGLELLGFQHPDPASAHRYRARWPNDVQQRDLQRWGVLEQEHPETFRGMLQFWCRRRR